MWFFYLFAFFAVLTFVLVPFVSGHVNKHMDPITVAYTTLMVRGVPFIIFVLFMYRFELAEPKLEFDDLALAFQPSAIFLSTIELLRAICLIVAFTLVPPTIGQSVFFSFPLMIIILAHFMLNVMLDVPLLIGAIVAFIGMLVIVFSGAKDLPKCSWKFVLGVIFAFIAALGEAFETVVLKKEDIQQNMGPILQLYSFFTFACIIASLIYFGCYIWFWRSRVKYPDDATTFILLIFKILCSSFLSTVFYYIALIGIPAQVFAFLPYAVILLTVVAEAIVGKKVIGWFKLTGCGLLIGGGVGSIIWMHFL